MSNEQKICSRLFQDINVIVPQQRIRNCCKTITGDIPLEEIKGETNYFDFNKNWDEAKQFMLREEDLPEICNTCIQNGPNSVRYIWNDWKDHIDEDQKNIIASSDNVNYYEIILSSACDLKCTYCEPKNSTAWDKELGSNYIYVSNEWKEEVISQLKTHLKKKIWDPSENYWFSFSGGEPTYSPETTDFIEYLLKVCRGKPNIMFHTNGNTKEKVLKRYLDMIESYPNVQFWFIFSFDGIGEVCEAIRTNLNWERGMKNFDTLYSYENVKCRVSPTICAYSLPYLKEQLEFFYKYSEGYEDNNFFCANMVMDYFSSIRHLPRHFVKYVEECLEFLDNVDNKNPFEEYYNHLCSLKNMIGSKELEPFIIKEMKDKFEYFKEKRPEHDWENLFPHIELLIDG